jgi:hypothetical protein
MAWRRLSFKYGVGLLILLLVQDHMESSSEETINQCLCRLEGQISDHVDEC